MTPRHLLAPARLAGSRLLATQSDERLVDLLRAGSEPAFEAIVSRYRAPLLRYCSALLGRERAEDAVQQTFVNAYEAMRKDDRPLRLKPWLYRIAHNTAHNSLRSRALRDEPLGDVAVEAEQPEAVVERRERLRAVLASVQGLPERQRDALVLRELEGRSYEEIAAALGAEGGAVRQLLNRARTTLRTAATGLTPVGLLLRVPGGGSESVAARVAELTGAAGTGAVAAKVAATALVTGAVAGGAAMAPLDDSGGRAPDRPAREAAAPAPAPSPANPAPAGVPAAASTASGRTGSTDGGPRDGDRSGPGDGDRDRREDSSGPGPGGDGDDDRVSNSGPGSSSSGPGPSGSGDDADSSGPGSGSSGSDSSGSGSGSSGSGSSASSGSGSSGSGSSGSDSDSSGSSGSTPDSYGSRSGEAEIGPTDAG